MSQAALNIRNCEAQGNVHAGRSNGSRLAGIIFLLIVLSVMIFGGLVMLKWMNDTTQFPLSKLVVTGQMRYTTNDDIRRVILSLGELGTFMSQDVNIIQHQIERLPWIQQVHVRKQYPDELKIHLVEYIPVARWNDIYMVNTEGKSFSIPTNYLSKESMPMLYGPEGSESEVLTGYHQMMDLLTASKLKLKVAIMTARRSWKLVLEDDTRLELGRNDDMNRLKRFIELLPILQKQGQVKNKRICYVDLRYASGAAVGWAPVPISVADNN